MSDHDNPWAKPKFLDRDGKLIREVDFIQLADTLDALVIQVTSLAADVAALKGRTDLSMSMADGSAIMKILKTLNAHVTLRKYEDGYTIQGDYVSAFYVEILIDRRFIREVTLSTSLYPHEYAITDAGRAALAEYEAAHGSR